MKRKPLSVAVLISGTGSNLKALIDATDSGRLDIDLRHVISNQAEAKGLEHARNAGIPVSVFDRENVAGRSALDAAITRCLDRVKPKLIVLAGYMRILGPEMVSHFDGRIINLHPSLLPKYPGLGTYRRVLEAGDTQHGSSMHFVSEGLDDGPLISQVRIPVLPGDTPQALAERLGPEEHRLIVATVELFTRHKVEKSPEGTVLDGSLLSEPLMLQSDDRLA